MSVTTVRLQAEVEQHLEAMESAAQGEVVDASEVHEWLSSWGTGGGGSGTHRTRIPFAISFLAATWFVIRSMPAPLLS